MAGEQSGTEVTATSESGTRPFQLVTTPDHLSRSAPSFHNPTEVLYENELMRGRLWVGIEAALGFLGEVSALVFNTPGTVARLLLAAGCGVLLVASVVGLVILRHDDRYSTRLAALYGYTSLAASLPGFYFFGWFSPITLLLALGAVVFAMGHSTRAVISMCAAVVTAHATLGALTIAGVLPDRGIATIRAAGTAPAILLLVACEAMFVTAFVLGRQFRGHALHGIERYGEVVRENTRRETLLQEAADELRRARNVGGPGRYTGLQLGSFRLGVLLGRGGMGEVYEASHHSSGQPAAVKVLTPAGDGGERQLRRFEREIEVVASVHSPHIVRVLGHSLPDDSVMYLAMERLRGASLGEELRQLQMPSIDYVLDMLHQVSRGISDAHEAGIIHRDLTTQNIFRHRDGDEAVWKVLDFGVSAFANVDSSLTGGGIVGTPNYMSPEQAQGGKVDQRTDLFALGCIAYRCLTGRPAFRGSGIAEILYRVVHHMPAQPSSLATLPPEVDLVLAIALAKNRRDRFASAGELVLAIDDACHGAIRRDTERKANELLALMPWHHRRLIGYGPPKTTGLGSSTSYR